MGNVRNHAADRPDQRIFINLSTLIRLFALLNLASKPRKMVSIQVLEPQKMRESMLEIAEREVEMYSTLQGFQNLESLNPSGRH